MSNIEEQSKKCIDADPANEQKLNELAINSATECTKLARQYQEKFFPEGDEIKMAENFSHKEEFAIVIFREASLWWNAQKSNYPIGNHYYDDGAIPTGNLLINFYICQQIRNLERGLEDNGINIGQLDIQEHLDIPFDEIINRDISKILKMGEEEEELPEIKVPDANSSSSGNVNNDEESIINQKIPDFEDGDEDECPEREVPEISEAEIESVLMRMKDLKPGQVINYKGKTITILAPVTIAKTD
jgi:hypothetical protein